MHVNRALLMPAFQECTHTCNSSCSSCFSCWTFSSSLFICVSLTEALPVSSLESCQDQKQTHIVFVVQTNRRQSQNWTMLFWPWTFTQTLLSLAALCAVSSFSLVASKVALTSLRSCSRSLTLCRLLRYMPRQRSSSCLRPQTVSSLDRVSTSGLYARGKKVELLTSMLWITATVISMQYVVCGMC